MKLLVRWIIAALALFVAAWIVPGIRVEGVAWVVYAVMAIILGLINAVVRPILKLLTCPLYPPDARGVCPGGQWHHIAPGIMHCSQLV